MNRNDFVMGFEMFILHQQTIYLECSHLDNFSFLNLLLILRLMFVHHRRLVLPLSSSKLHSHSNPISHRRALSIQSKFLYSITLSTLSVYFSFSIGDWVHVLLN